MPFISICIPAYKRSRYLNRLLESIAQQTYRDYEVIITDDSPDDEVKQVYEKYTSQLPLRYHKNAATLGTPANWNAGMTLAEGKWIKLMHDDDWFAEATALEQFAKTAEQQSSDFLFSAYINVFEKTNTSKIVFPELFRLKQAEKEPAVLVAKNFIGPPSVTMHRNDGKFAYDTQLKWLVDIDMYRRRMEEQGFCYIPAPLVNVGLSDTQVTSHTKNIGNVEVPEHFHFLQKMGIGKLRNILIYDYNWRFFRNFNIRKTEDIRQYGYEGEVHPVLQRIIKAQSNISPALLKKGVFSKALMWLHFMRNRRHIPAAE
ncbi:MAG: glycosyltransferase family 2 protein [Ferruginibacter sp.]